MNQIKKILMNKKSLIFNLGTKGLLFLITSWIIAYSLFLYANDKSLNQIAFFAKAYLTVTLGFFVVIFGFILLVILLFLLIIVLAFLFGSYKFKVFNYKNFINLHKRKEKYKDKKIIDAEYTIKE